MILLLTIAFIAFPGEHCKIHVGLTEIVEILPSILLLRGIELRVSNSFIKKSTNSYVFFGNIFDTLLIFFHVYKEN